MSLVNPKRYCLYLKITRDEKISILKRWASDMREIQVAEEENMQGRNHLDIYEKILQALSALEAPIDTEHNPPTKQGG